ncbi:MAG TPA: N-6 DNA methylase [Candidatus Polarisedimenticolia bacterium]|jgi:hypothetical protein
MIGRTLAPPRTQSTLGVSGAGSVNLGLLCKLAASRAVDPRRLGDPLDHLAWVESGAPFEEAGVRGFLDGIPSDLDGADAAQVAEMLDLVERGGGAQAGPLYMKTRPRRARHAGGEYYTPAWLVEHVLDRAGFTGRTDDALLDPMCGAGVFLTAALARMRRARPLARPGELTALVQGMDVNPLAVLMARAAYLDALKDQVGVEPIAIPVACVDAILKEEDVPAFDVVAGNPPWVSWESLDEGYRARTRDLWMHHGLFPDGGMQVMLGRGKKDLSMLATYAAAQKYLRPRGRLVFVITQSVFKSVGGGAGFRRFVLGDGTPLRVIGVDDFSARAVFPKTAARAAVLTLVKGEPTTWPVAYRSWGANGAAPREGWAEPVDRADATSAWLTGPRDRIDALRLVLGPSAYRARAGAYTGGANGVYWVSPVAGTDQVVNLPESGKRSVPAVTARVEPDLIYPLLRPSRLGRFHAEPTDSILLPQDPIRRRGLDESVMAERYPLALAYLGRFRAELAARRDRGTRCLIEAGAPFYSIFSVSAETLATWKVVWPRIASRLVAAAVGPREGRPVIPQETCTFIACDSEEEACYLAGLMNSSLVNEAARAFAQTGGKSFGAPHLLRQIAIPRYDRVRASHRALSALVRERGVALTQEDLDSAASGVWAALTAS